MKKSSMIIGIGLLILCVGGYFGVKAYNNNETKKEEAKKMSPIEVIAADVTGMSYVYDGVTMAFQKEGENWVYSEDASIDINEETIDGMIEEACAVTSTQIVTAENLSDYGFDTPETTITLTTANGTTEIVVGMYNEMIAQYYMSINGSLDMYLIDGMLVSSFANTLENLIVKETESTETETAEDAVTESAEAETAESTATESTETAGSTETESAEAETMESTATESAEAETTESTEAAESTATENAEAKTAESTATESVETETENAEAETVENTETVQ